MPPHTVTSNSGSRRISPPLRSAGKPQSTSPATDKPEGDQTAPKRPKRTLKLTASQRERKRAIDREAQRSIRLKTKNYIAHLENLVRIMENGGSAPKTGEGASTPERMNGEQNDEGARTLLYQLQQSEQEVTRLKEMLANVQRLYATGQYPAVNFDSSWLIDTNSYNTGQVPTHPNVVRYTSHDQRENCASIYSQSSDSSSAMGDMGYQPQPYDQMIPTDTCSPDYSAMSIGSRRTPLSQQAHHNVSGSARTPSSVPPTSEPTSITKAMDGELYYLSEREVNRVLAGGPQSFSNQALDEDILVRSVLHGWRDAQDHYLLDVGWEALRTMDQNIFDDCGIVERMALLFVVRLKLLHQGGLDPQYLAPLPHFLHRTVAEDPETLKSAPVLEHHVWPGVRAILSRNPPKYANNRFWDAYRQSFKFAWPFDISDAYTRDDSTQLYSLSLAFKQRIYDLGSWTMKREFFQQFGEFSGSIAVFEPVTNRSLTGRSASNSARNSPQSSQQTHVPKIKDEAARQSVSLQPQTHGYPVSAPPLHSHLPATTGAEVAVTSMPYTSGVEAWLGDPELVPQYWNMQPTMGVTYEVSPQSWPDAQRGYVG
jgi:hypothetical protein